MKVSSKPPAFSINQILVPCRRRTGGLVGSGLVTVNFNVNNRPVSLPLRSPLIVRALLDEKMVTEAAEHCLERAQYGGDLNEEGRLEYFIQARDLFSQAGCLDQAVAVGEIIVARIDDLAAKHPHLKALGDIFSNRAEYERAAASYRQATEMAPDAEKAGYKLLEAGALEALGHLKSAAGLYAEASDHESAARCGQAYAEKASGQESMEAYEFTAGQLRQLGGLSEAGACLSKAAAIAEELNLTSKAAELYAAIGDHGATARCLEAEAGKLSGERAVAAYAAASTQWKQAGNMEESLTALLKAGEAARKAGLRERAIEIFTSVKALAVEQGEGNNAAGMVSKEATRLHKLMEKLRDMETAMQKASSLVGQCRRRPDPDLFEQINRALGEAANLFGEIVKTADTVEIEKLRKDQAALLRSYADIAYEEADKSGEHRKATYYGYAADAYFQAGRQLMGLNRARDAIDNFRLALECNLRAQRETGAGAAFRAMLNAEDPTSRNAMAAAEIREMRSATGRLTEFLKPIAKEVCVK